MLEGIPISGWCAQEGIPNNAISAPKLADFVVHLFRVGLACITFVFIILLFLLV